MRIRSVVVSNFRSIKSDELTCEPLTALVGANGAGKSSFLRALHIFYEGPVRIEEDDFYNGDASQEITVSVTFDELPEEAEVLFQRYIVAGTLPVEQVLRWDGAKVKATYHGAIPQNPAFDKLRAAFRVRDRGKTAKAELERLRADYEDLPTWTTIADTQESIRLWESEHPDQCVRSRDEGQFFGFRQVGQGYLGRFTRLLYIPAVRDAAEDAAEGRSSIFTQLLDLVVRRVLAKKPELAALESEFLTQLEDLVSPDSNPELGTLQDSLTGSLQVLSRNLQSSSAGSLCPDFEPPCRKPTSD